MVWRTFDGICLIMKPWGNVYATTQIEPTLKTLSCKTVNFALLGKTVYFIPHLDLHYNCTFSRMLAILVTISVQLNIASGIIQINSSLETAVATPFRASFIELIDY